MAGTSEQTSKLGANSFAKMLVDAGILSPEQYTIALDTAKRDKESLVRVLERDGLVLSRDLAALLAIYTSLPMADLRTETIDPKAVAMLPMEVARQYNVLPIRRDDQSLTVALPDPTDLQTMQDLTIRTGLIIDPVVATPKDIVEHIDLSYRLTEISDSPDKDDVRVTANVIRDAQPAEVIDLLMRQALQDRTSDIHIQPTETYLRIRFRIDGILHDVMKLPLEMHPTFISRLKIMSGMNIAERRRPQDGQFSVEIQNRTVDVRVAVSGTVTGEMAVLRILDKEYTILGLDQLGMDEKILDVYRNLLRLPYGVIIVCGPTGAGKSSTLYASILQMNRTEQNIISLEDPVEYHIADTNQMQVHPEAGITFAGQLRSILRLDPDVILIGEIRDQETAVIAIQAALTGHLVLTTLHANDAVSALLRLKDLGVPPYLVTASVAGIVAQRMVRMTCHACQAMTDRPLDEQHAYKAVMGEEQERFIYGSGCNACTQTGYRGRSGVFEMLTMTDELRQMFLTETPRSEMSKRAVRDGMVPLRKAAMQKVKEGITTPFEVMRILFTLDGSGGDF
ncbi:MAG: Flp pilus assembly complex ATPase component TadA [Chloroflexi bacterium]|nr:Flp pilus assembly complex ATPase component TadA [Chloroflexota bacterium]MCI0796001.1 Flp pilus assembly complex ATPase component TadA [Chloroflexota bacterium]